jgi:hypothetical protein
MKVNWRRTFKKGKMTKEVIREEKNVKKFGMLETQRLVQSKDMPEAGPVVTYRLEEEIETRIAAELKALIRIGKPTMSSQFDERREALQRIVVECCKEMDKERGGVESISS